MDTLDKIKELANGILDNSISIQEQDEELAYSGILDDMDKEQEDYNEGYNDGYKAAMQDILYRIEQHLK